MKLSDGRSIVAIDPTSRGLAFVVFENGDVLDWGECTNRNGDRDERRNVDRLIDGCAAEVLVLEDPDAGGCQRRPRVRALLRAIMSHARGRGVAVIAIARKDVRRSWAVRGATSKEAVAAAIAVRFAELVAGVPPRRKASRNEDPRVNIFDAASLAIHACETSPVVL